MLQTFQTILVLSGLIFVCIIILALVTSFLVAIFGGGPFVPTPIKAVKEILKHAEIKKGDRLYDIGAGDGRYLHYAEKLYGAKATGFEIDPFVYAIAKINRFLFGWKGKMIRGNFQKYPLTDADIVICYMLPRTLEQYQKKFDKELKENCKIISYSFHVGNYQPYKEIKANKKTGIKKIFIYKIQRKRDESAKNSTKKKTTFIKT